MINAPENWTPSAPSVIDDAHFALPTAYAVELATDFAIRNASVPIGDVAFALRGYTLGISAGLDVGGTEAIATLVLTNGTLETDHTSIGSTLGSGGILTVRGGAATLISDIVYVGNEGAGTFVVEQGATASSSAAAIGTGGSPGVTSGANVRGVDATWTNSGTLALYGTGTLTVDDGGSVDSSNFEIGNPNSPTSTATVARGGVLSCNDLQVRGRLFVESGGKLTTQFGAVTSGRVSISGAGSEWTTRHLGIGGNGGSLTISNGGKVHCVTDAYLGGGESLGQVGRATITGAGSEWNIDGYLQVGFFAIGDVSILNGGTLRNSLWAAIGNSSGDFPFGAVEVSGAGSTWNSGSISVYGGELRVTDGGRVTSSAAHLLGSHRDMANVTVDGHGSVWFVKRVPGQDGQLSGGELSIGSSHYHGALTISGGGFLSNYNANVGNGTSGSVAVMGFGSMWVSEGSVTVGGSLPDDGFGLLTVADNANVAVNRNLDIGWGSVVHLNGGHLWADTITFPGGVFSWTSGALTVREFRGDLLNRRGGLRPQSFHVIANEGISMAAVGNTHIEGAYVQRSGASLEIDIAGDGAGQLYDVVTAERALLSGALLVTLFDFLPQPLDTFEILRTEYLSGAFDNVASGDRLTTRDGAGSFRVYYGTGSPHDPNRVVLAEFERADRSGDLDGDGQVDGGDFLAWQRALGSSGPMGDGNGDRLVNQADLISWQDSFASLGGGSVLQVPEPTVGLMIGVGILPVVGMHRTRLYRRRS
jgi:T5SS/PEP-CTERM-associated repeat protein